MGLSYADTDWMVTSKGKAFLQKVRSQPSTAGTYDAFTGTTVCNNATDDDGGFYLYQAPLNIQGTAYECTGQVFSSYAADGLNMSHYSASIYDATVAMIEGIISYSSIHNGGLIPRKISGVQLKAFMVSNISFDGYSGPISFSSGSKHIDNFGVGDRITGVRFGLLDFNPGNGSMSQFALERFGTWSSESGFGLCADDAGTYDYIAALTGACKSFILIDHLPKDHADPVVQQMPDGMRAGLIFLAALQLAVCLFIGSSLTYFRKKRLMKASQPVMMWLVLSMGLWSAARTLTAAFDMDNGTCIADYWTGHLAFSGIIALFIKSLRVHLLVNAGGMKRVKISTTQVILFTAGILGFFILYMMISTVVSVPHAAMRIRTAITGQDTHIYYCTADVIGMEYFLYAFEAVILLLTAKLCYDTKDLPDAINETKVMAFGTSITTMFTRYD
jgi:hypothetical protein